MSNSQEISEKTSTIFSQSTMAFESSKETVIHCIGGRQAVDYCINESCSKEPFQCGRKKCECRLDHRLCPKAQIDAALDIIKSKITDTEQIKANIQASFDNLIGSLSETRAKLISQIGQNYNYYKLHRIEKCFYFHTKRQNIDHFTSSHAAQLWSVIKDNLIPKFDPIAEINKQINKISELISTAINDFSSEVKQILLKQQLIEKQQQEGSPNKRTVEQIFKGKSSVLTRAQHIERLKNMFAEKISRAELIFKASEHEFSLKKYYEICGQVPDTVIVCKTNKDKVIGGYTPLKFKTQLPNSSYIADETSKSMIFSLTENDKFQLKNKKNALHLSKSRGRISFGNTEFEIRDNSSQPNSCRSYFQDAYYSNPNYKNQKQSFIKFNGNQSEKFSTKDWEVWKIQFCPNQFN